MKKKEVEITIQVEESTAPVPKKDTKYFSDILKLATGNGFVQVFKVISSPILSRLFMPESFGILQNFLSIGKPLGLVSSLCYNRAILLPKERKQAANLLILTLILTIITSSLLFALVWLFNDDLAMLLNSPELEKFLWLIPIFVAAMGILESIKQWNSLESKYMRLSIAQVGSEVLGDGFTAGFGFAGLNTSGIMIIMNVIGQLFATIVFTYLVFKEDLKYIIDNLDWGIMKEGLVKYKKLPLFNLWSTLLSNMALYLPSVLLSAYFSPTIAGYYALGNNAIRLPITVLGNSIGQVLYQRCAKAYNEGGMTHVFEGTFKYLIVISLFPMLLISIIGQELFVVAFGARWVDAGIYSQILSLWTFLVFIAYPISYIPNIVNKNEQFLVFQLAIFITRVASLVYGGMKGDVLLGLWLFTISGIVVYAALIFWITSISGMANKNTIKYFVNNFLYSTPFLLMILAFKLWNPVTQTKLLGFRMDYLALIFVSAVIGVLYYAIYLSRDKTFREEFNRVVRTFKTKKA